MFKVRIWGLDTVSSRPENILEVRGLCKTYRQGRWWQEKFECCALDDVNLSLPAGRTLALIGESGCGKTTLAMCLVGLEEPDAGEILFNGMELPNIRAPQKVSEGKNIQLIFQDSAGALNPRMSALEIVEEPLRINLRCSRAECSKLAEEMMERVEISRAWKHRLPHEFSGGQRQRLAIARALVLKPRVLILDEVFVGLDLSVQGQIANLLLDLQQSDKLTYLCISHNLALLGQMADTIAVMDRGRIVESCSWVDLSERRLDFARNLRHGQEIVPLALGARSGA
jgi:ABC-type glutathione transport system ATPase component